MRLSKPLILFLLAVPATVFAAEERFELRDDATVSIKNVSGSVVVAAGNAGELRISSVLDEGVELLVTGSSTDRLVEARHEDDDDNAEAQLTIHVPRGVRLEISTVSADASVKDAGRAVTVRTVSGDVRLDTPAASVEARTVSGDIVLVSSSGKTVLHTVSGDIRAQGMRDQLDVESVSGDLNIEIGDAGAVDLSTVSGDIHARVGAGEHVALSVKSLSGDVSVKLAEGISAVLTAKTYSGELRSAFGDTDGGDTSSIRADLGGARGRVHVQTFSGDVRVLKE